MWWDVSDEKFKKIVENKIKKGKTRFALEQAFACFIVLLILDLFFYGFLEQGIKFTANGLRFTTDFIFNLSVNLTVMPIGFYFIALKGWPDIERQYEFVKEMELRKAANDSQP